MVTLWCPKNFYGIKTVFAENELSADFVTANCNHDALIHNMIETEAQYTQVMTCNREHNLYVNSKCLEQPLHLCNLIRVYYYIPCTDPEKSTYTDRFS